MNDEEDILKYECRNCRKCNVCAKVIPISQDPLECSLCDKRVHTSCNKFDKNDYNYYQNNNSPEFFCLECLKTALPLQSLDNNHFQLAIKAINCPDEYDADEIQLSHTQKEMIKKLNTAIASGIDLESEDDDIRPINCKYYTTEQFSKKKFGSTKHLSILHLNIHSLEFHIEDLRTSLKILGTSFNFICITETKIRKNNDPKSDITIEGYQAPVGMPTEAQKGGVVIYIQDGIDWKPREDLNMHKPKELESYFIETIEKKGKNSIIGAIYRHPCMNKEMFTDDYMEPLTEKLTKENKHIYLAGDYNFDLLSTNDKDNFHFFETMMSNHMIPTITVPTKINPKKNTVIDNIFTNQINPDIISGNIALAISDHLPSFLVIPRDNQNHIPKKNNIYTRNMKDFDRENFLLDFLEIDWDEILQANRNDVNYSFSIFMEKINLLMDKYMPLRKVSNKEYKRRFKPWITDLILSKIHKRNKELSKMAKCKDAETKSTLRLSVKTLKNEITALTRKNKKDYYNEYFITNKNNLLEIWKGIKEIINIKTKNFSHPTCVIKNKKTLTDPKEIADAFNSYYTSIADDILQKRKYDGRKHFSDYMGAPFEKSFAAYPCDNTEVGNIITSLSPRKSYGPNSIPVTVLHLLKNDISHPLSIIFNLSFSTGTHPDLLKIAKTITIHKKGSKLEVGNYRPISLLSNINKILEKLMFNRVYSFLEVNKLIYKLQFGFRQRHNINHALVQITESIRKSLDDGNFACGVFIDLQKAFDTVNHAILTSKMEYYGIRGVANNWFKSYLSQRSQFVSIQGFNSDEKAVLHGVPQGSVLGPLLFLIYINDLHKAIKNSSVYHFADDTNLLRFSSSPKKLQKELNFDLKCLYNWLLANKISLNCSKTELIFFHTNEKDPTRSFTFKIKINGHAIHPTTHLKYLGVYLDSTLSGNYHISILTKKLKRANGMLSKVRHYVPKEELKSIYHSIFSSHMIYGCQIWGQGSENHIASIQKLQNRALRTIEFKNKDDDVDPLYVSNYVLKLTDFIKLQNCLLTHQFLNNQLPDCFNDYYFKLHTLYQTETRNSKLGCLFQPSRRTTNYGLNSISHKSIISWNEITKQMKTDLSSLSFHELKNIITISLISKYNHEDNVSLNHETIRQLLNNRANNRVNNNNINGPHQRRAGLVRPIDMPSRWGPAVPGAVPVNL